MLESIKEEDIKFIEFLYDSLCVSESFFTNYDNLGLFDEGKLGHIRLGQIPLLSQEYIIADDPKLSIKENFSLKVGAGRSYVLAGRNFGKTLCEKIDMLISIMLLDGWPMGLTSYDAVHIRGVMEPVLGCLDTHPIFKHFLYRKVKSPTYLLTGMNHSTIEGINMNITAQSPGCYDKETEVLTETGWKYFKNLQSLDKLLSLDLKTQKCDFYNFKHLIKVPYKGYLKKLNSRTSEFLVTPNHNLVVKNNDILELKEVSAEKLGKQIYCPSTFKFKGKKHKFITLKAISNSKPVQFKFEFINWCKFIAWYLSEGHLRTKDGHYRLFIGQKNKNVELEAVLNKLNLHYSKRFDKHSNIWSYQINNKAVVLHIQKYCGEKKNKKIPAYIKTSHYTNCKSFIDEYVYGDGNVYYQDKKYRTVCIFSTIKQLADDLQEVAQKAGYKTHLRTKTQNTHINGHYYTIVVYFINLSNCKFTVFKKKNIEDVFYDDVVYSVDIEPYHNIFVRRNGCVMWSGNSQFFQKHLKKIWVEEFSFETDEVYNKRVDSRHELGCIERASGMCNFTKHSPSGRIFYDRSLKPAVVNLPQYINPLWNDAEKKKAAKKFGGEQSIGFRIYVKGEVVEEGLSVFDMARIRPFYKEGKILKTVEILKSNFVYYQQLLSVLERPSNIEQVYICADIGEAAPSEIIVLFKINDKFKFTYNITLQNLKDSEQAAIFDYIISLLKANLVGIDTTDGTGRAIYRALEEKYPKENLVWVAFNEKISVEFAKDDKDQIIYQGGEPTYVEEFVSEWSIKHLKDVLYDGKVEIPEDAYKLDTQLNSVRVFQSGTRLRYELTSEEDHLFQAFQVFSIVHWMNEFNLLKPIKTKIFAKSGV